MKKYFYLLILSSLLFVGARCSPAPTTPVAPAQIPAAPAPKDVPETSKVPANNVVTYTDSGFFPAELPIKVGTTVKFQNNASDAMRVASNPHPVHTGYPTTGGCVGSTFDSCENIGPGNSWSFTFDKVGTWGYHNHLNPSEMGTIVVQP